jgi:hypothetical protein
VDDDDDEATMPVTNGAGTSLTSSWIFSIVQKLKMLFFWILLDFTAALASHRPSNSVGFFPPFLPGGVRGMRCMMIDDADDDDDSFIHDGVWPWSVGVRDSRIMLFSSF